MIFNFPIDRISMIIIQKFNLFDTEIVDILLLPSIWKTSHFEQAIAFWASTYQANVCYNINQLNAGIGITKQESFR